MSETLVTFNGKAVCFHSKLASVNGTPVSTNWHTTVYEYSDYAPGILLHFDTDTVVSSFAYINNENAQALHTSHIVYHMTNFEEIRTRTTESTFYWENILSTDDATIVLTECPFKDVDGNTLYRHDVTLNNVLNCSAGEWYLLPIFKNQWAANYVSYNDESTHKILEFPINSVGLDSWTGIPSERQDTVCYFEVNGNIV